MQSVVKDKKDSQSSQVLAKAADLVWEFFWWGGEDG